MEAAEAGQDGQDRKLESVPDPDNPVIEGSAGQLSMNVGGKKVTSSEFRLQGRAVEVEGEYRKGETVRLEVECVVGEIAFADKTDSQTGEVTACTRRHKARVVAVKRLG